MKANVFGNELYNQLMDDLAEVEERREEYRAKYGYDVYDEDNFNEQVSLIKAKMSILKDEHGLMDFDAWIDENGDEVWVKWVNTKYGTALVGRGIFASSEKALLKKTGWHIEERKVPVWVKPKKYGYGHEFVRWHTNMATGEYVGYPS